MKPYLSITIGPIFKTITQARSTREIWASSYVFSLLMKEILTILNGQSKVEAILNPTVESLTDPETHHGAGIYPDRCHILLKEKMTNSEMANLRENALEALDFWDDKSKQSYFQIYAVQTAFDDTQDESVLAHLNKIMDSVELQQKFLQSGEIYIIKELKGSFQKQYKKGRLPSLIEICNQEYSQSEHFSLLNPKEENLEEEEKALKQFKNKIDAFKTRNKYFAIIEADGDGIGSKVQGLGNDVKEIKPFSKKLFNFSREAAGIIHNFGALPVYIGGDDMLFVAPLVNKKQQTFFDLIDQLDKSFKKIMGEEVSVSYGVSIGYYKYPMGDVMRNAHDLLSYSAKKLKIGDRKKNAIAFQVRKHSGQTFGCIFPKGTEAYKEFIKMLQTHHNNLEESFLSSLIYTLTEHQYLLNQALSAGNEEYFFEHHFNEPVHQNNEFLKSVEKLARLIYDDLKGVAPNSGWKEYGNPKDKKELDKRQNLTKEELAILKSNLVISTVLYSCLRLIQFLNAKDHD